MIQYLLSQWVKKHTRLSESRKRGTISLLQMKALNFGKVKRFVQGHIARVSPQWKSSLLILRPDV